MDNNTTSAQNGANTAAQNAQNTTATASGNNAEKTFTQDEVNRIVSERLAREREKNATPPQPTEAEQREAELNKRESKMNCKEFIKQNKFPEGLLDIFNSDNEEEFKKNVAQLLKVFPQIMEPICNPVHSTNSGAAAFDNKLANIFKN